MNAKEHLRHQGEMLIPAIAYGDAAGLPVETRSYGYIAAKYGQINRLIPVSENPYFESSPYPGMWSDDTQLTIAVADALIRAGKFDIDTMAETHLEAYAETPFLVKDGVETTKKRGWGGSTTQAMERLKAGVSPAESGTPDGSGNGVLMKMAPLALWHAAHKVSDEERHDDYDALTNMTHDSDAARLTTRVHGDMLNHLIRFGHDGSMTFNEVLRDSVAHHEQAIASRGWFGETFTYLRTRRGDYLRNAILDNTDGKGFYAPQTLAMTYGAFLANEGNLSKSVFEAVNLGGDTDSTASIAAAMSVFATRRTIHLPPDYKELDRYDALKFISRQLAKTALS